ncbi:MAG TPA: hypothetical protein VL069_14165 [Opitutus sp.]|nr:hypothetical protein [Opitutus sp.]
MDPYVRLSRGLSPEEPIARPSFGIDLFSEETPPPWLRRLPDHLPPFPLFEKEGVVIYEITDRTRPEQALVRSVRTFLYSGQLTAAQNLIHELESYPGDLASQIALARVHMASRNRTGVDAALEQAERLVAQTADIFDDSSLRRLTPGSLKNLIGLAKRLVVVWPKPHLENLAHQLLPPDGRI